MEVTFKLGLQIRLVEAIFQIKANQSIWIQVRLLIEDKTVSPLAIDVDDMNFEHHQALSYYNKQFVLGGSQFISVKEIRFITFVYSQTREGRIHYSHNPWAHVPPKFLSFRPEIQNGDGHLPIVGNDLDFELSEYSTSTTSSSGPVVQPESVIFELDCFSDDPEHYVLVSKTKPIRCVALTPCFDDQTGRFKHPTFGITFKMYDVDFQGFSTDIFAHVKMRRGNSV